MLKADMNALWGTLSEVSMGGKYYLESGIGDKDLQLIYGSKVLELERRKSGFLFQCIYGTVMVTDPHAIACGDNVSDISWQMDHQLRVTTMIHTLEGSMGVQNYQEAMQNLKEQKESLWIKYTVNTVGGALTVFSPQIGVAVQAVMGVSEGVALKTGVNSMKALDKMGVIKNEYAQQWKNATAGMNVLGSCIDYMNEVEKLKQKGETLSMQQKVEWFGAVSSFDAGGLRGQSIRDYIIRKPFSN